MFRSQQATNPPSPYPVVTPMRLITSLSPNRIPRQQKCVNSWISRGCTVTAVQSVGEIESLIQHFPSVNFVETHLVGDVFGRPKSVRLRSLLDLITDGPSMIINSDIEITTSTEVFTGYWGDLQHNSIKMGVRWDCSRRFNVPPALLKYGIDVFLLSPETARMLPDLGMTIGCPAWDYWIPWHLNRLSVTIHTSKRIEFMHEVHEVNWSKNEYDIGIRIMQDNYPNLTSPMLGSFIQELTGRTALKLRKIPV